MLASIAKSLAVTAAAAALALIGALPVAHPARAEVKPGAIAPAFTLADTSGKAIDLAALKGKVVVLEWTNHLCPYVRKHYETATMQTLQRDATTQGVVWLTIIASARGTQGYVEALEADKLTADRKAAPTHVLFDTDGRVGRAYRASTTPHMFVIDRDGRLVYMGGIDDKPSADHAAIKGARPYVREAITAVLAGKPVATASTRPYGCSIKYAVPRR